MAGDEELLSLVMTPGAKPVAEAGQANQERSISGPAAIDRVVPRDRPVYEATAGRQTRHGR